jgi:hypothetical protein
MMNWLSAIKRIKRRYYPVNISYSGIPDDGNHFKNKYGDKTFFADNWRNRAITVCRVDRPMTKPALNL